MENPNEQCLKAAESITHLLNRIQESVTEVKLAADAGNATWPQTGTLNEAHKMLSEIETFVWQKPTYTIVIPVKQQVTQLIEDKAAVESIPTPVQEPGVITEAERRHITDIADGRDSAIVSIRMALRQRTGRAWSVCGGRGTSWGWIKIQSVPSRMKDWSITDEDRETLRVALGLGSVHQQGVSVPASAGHRREYVARARHGNACGFKGEQYWD